MTRHMNNWLIRLIVRAERWIRPGLYGARIGISVGVAGFVGTLLTFFHDWQQSNSTRYVAESGVPPALVGSAFLAAAVLMLIRGWPRVFGFVLSFALCSWFTVALIVEINRHTITKSPFIAGVAVGYSCFQLLGLVAGVIDRDRMLEG